MTSTESSQHPEATKPPAYFKEALEDAERLLKYAAEIGIEVDATTRSSILQARAAFSSGWTEDMAARLLLALTHLAARLRPVTAASLKAYHSETRPTMHTYLIWAIILTAIIIPTSIATFVTSNISATISGDIARANTLAVKLNTELGPQAKADVGLHDQLTDLQEYAATLRLIYARAQRLNWYVFPRVPVPRPLRGPEGNDKVDNYQLAEYLKAKFELPVPLEIDKLPEARDQMTSTYQDVRYFAQTIMTDVSTFYGAINSCLLPILYALLGTCAFLLRTFEDQMAARTFTPSAANSARFLIAAIGGTVIGLFGNFTQQTSASPLAIAFLVGYGVDVFFTFLEGLIKAFTKGAVGSPQPHAGTVSGKE